MSNKCNTLKIPESSRSSFC